MTLRLAQAPCALLLACLLAACGGGGGSGGNNTDNNDDTPNEPAPLAGECEGSGSVNVTGVIEYEFVPAVERTGGARLDYASAEFRPVRGAEVLAACPGTSTFYDAGVTGVDGEYSLLVPENVDVVIRVRAALDIDADGAAEVRVVDNTRAQGTWSAEGEPLGSGTTDIQVNLRATSGWNGSTYSGTRAAAPFAILDSVYIAMQKVLSVQTDADFPLLKINWSPKNTDTDSRGRSCANTMEDYPFDDGCIGTSFYANYRGSAGRNIFVLGDANNDTDEYDNHVILHEWGHYYEDAFSRSDSIGGGHRGGDALDPRVAFGEGWGNAFAGIATDDPVYVDTIGSGQSSGFAMSVEDEYEGAAGWWNETTVQEILYDLYDTANDDDAVLGFGPIHDVLRSGQRTTAAMTTLFSFIHFLKAHPAASHVDDVVAAHDIAAINDEWGTGRDARDDGSEFGAGTEDYVYPVYTPVDSGNAVICTTNAVDPVSQTEYNRLGVRRFLSFSVDTSGDWTITLAGDEGSDPDFYIWRNGELVEMGESFGATETETTFLSTGVTYVIEVLDYKNADEETGGGRSCLDLTLSQG